MVKHGPPLAGFFASIGFVMPIVVQAIGLQVSIVLSGIVMVGFIVKIIWTVRHIAGFNRSII